MIELTDDDGLRAATSDDPLLLLAARGFAGGVRAWTLGGAAAVATPAFSGRDRIAVCGPVDDATALVRRVLAECGSGYRPFGDAELIRAVVAGLAGVEIASSFGFMCRTAPGLGLGATPAHWLAADELDEAAALLDAHFASSVAHPHRPGATGWAGVRDGAGRLTALAADVESAPTVGLLAGVVAHPEHGRGRGHAEAACRLVLDTHLRLRGRTALLVEERNAPAIRLYTRLGLALRPLASAQQL